jgi:putative ABC transport system permease protein
VALPLSYSVRSLFARRLRTGLTVAVIALVVIATTLFLGLITSLRRTLVTTGDPANLIVMRKGSSNDGSSQMSLQAVQDVRFSEGIERDSAGNPMISPELVVQPFFHRTDGGRENVLVRGVEPEPALQVHRSVRLLEGRMFRPSSGEAVVGTGVAGRYRGARIGEELAFGRGHWKVVGLFESGGSSFESEVWVDARELANDAKRPFPYSSFRLRVTAGADAEALARRIGDDPRHALEALPEREYYAKQAESANTLYILVVGLAVLAGVGAVFGATNTLYAAVQARTAEIGTLRAIGFSRAAILVSFLVESLLTAGFGFLIGGSLAWLLGLAVSEALGGVGFGAATFTTNVVQLRVAPSDLLAALGLALAIGLLGGLAPARRAGTHRRREGLRKA